MLIVSFSKNAMFWFELRFTSLVNRVRHCILSLTLQGEEFTRYAVPLFGYWYNFCINGPNGKTGVKGVFTKPHVDGKNLALMMCVVYVWGKYSCPFSCLYGRSRSIPRGF